MTIVLPLGAVAHQLRKIEAHLRVLNMQALDLAREHNDRQLRGQIEAKLENISEALSSVAQLVADIERDICSSRTNLPRTPIGAESAASPPLVPIDDLRPARDAAASRYSTRKSYADLDD